MRRLGALIAAGPLLARLLAWPCLHPETGAGRAAQAGRGLGAGLGHGGGAGLCASRPHAAGRGWGLALPHGLAGLAAGARAERGAAAPQVAATP